MDIIHRPDISIYPFLTIKEYIIRTGKEESPSDKYIIRVETRVRKTDENGIYWFWHYMKQFQFIDPYPAKRKLHLLSQKEQFMQMIHMDIYEILICAIVNEQFAVKDEDQTSEHKRFQNLKQY